MVNSSWTKGHIDSLWRTDADIVYPPCDTDRLNEYSLEGRKQKIVSVAQFRYVNHWIATIIIVNVTFYSLDQRKIIQCKSRH